MVTNITYLFLHDSIVEIAEEDPYGNAKEFSLVRPVLVHLCVK